MAEDDLLVRLREVFKPQANQSNFGPDGRVAPALGLLVEAVLKLDKTSTELATANIRLTRTYTWLTVAILAVSIIQIVLMLRGH